MIDEGRLDQLSRRIQQDIAAGAAFGGIEGASFAIARNNEVLVEKGFGAAAAGTPMLLLSITKTVLDSALWCLFDEGLSPDTPIERLIPGFMGGSAPALTTAMVQSHMGGFAFQPLDHPAHFDRSQRLRAFERWRTDFAPGSQYEYHPLNGSWVLAEVIERVTGVDYRDYLQQRVLEPLGLRGDRLVALGDRHHDLGGVLLPIDCSRGWTPDRTKLPPVAAGLGSREGIAHGVPGAGAVGTAAGVAMLYQAFLHDPLRLWRPERLQDARSHVRVDGPDTFGRPILRTMSFMLAGAPGDRYGERMFFGQAVSEHAFGHQGQGGQVAWADPATGLSFCFLTNTIVFPPGGCFHPRAPALSTLAAAAAVLQ